MNPVTHRASHDRTSARRTAARVRLVCCAGLAACAMSLVAGASSLRADEPEKAAEASVPEASAPATADAGGADAARDDGTTADPAARLRGRAEQLEVLARKVREAATAIDGGTPPAQALRSIEEAARPFRGDWLERTLFSRPGFRRGPGLGPGPGPGERGRGEPNDAMEPGAGALPEGGEMGRDGPRPGAGREEGRGGGREGGGPRPRLLTEEELARVMEFARANLPRIAERLDAIRATDPAGADMLMARLGPRVCDAMETRDPEMRRLRLAEIQSGSDVLEAIRNLRAAKGADEATRDAAAEALRVALSAQFDARQGIQRREIQNIEKRLETLRAESERREASRDVVIDELVARALREQ